MGKQLDGVSFTVNGIPMSIGRSLLNKTLLAFLRENVGLTGAKCGCDDGTCGVCTVLIDGRARRSCRVILSSLDGAEVQTIEGLVVDGRLHLIQEAFLEKGAVQCGFCTPGIIMSVKAFLDRTPSPTKKQILKVLSRHYCRCTGYASMMRAVEHAAKKLRGSVQDDTDTGDVRVRLDDPHIARTTGGLKFAGDYYPRGMLWGKVLFSAHAHALITGLDVSRATSLAGVHAILTCQDFPGQVEFGRIIQDQPVLAKDKVRHLGEAVAVVFAEDPVIAAKAIDLIEVEYKPLAGTFDVLESMEEEAPLIHESNIARRFNYKRGNAGNRLKEADIIISEHYSTPFIEHGYLETETGIGFPDDQGGVIIRYGTQMPFHSRDVVCKALKLPHDKVRVIADPLGGGFGGKCDVLLEPWLALGALKTGRPVRIALTRRESFLASTKKHPFYMHYTTGVSKDGRLVAIEARLVADTGAYASVGPSVLEQAVIFAGGPYHWPHASIEGLAVYTNNPIGGAMRGYGINQVAFAVETQMDAMARALGMDPLKFRLMNALEPGSLSLTGEMMGADTSIKAVLEKLRVATGGLELPRLDGKSIGLGVAAGYKNIGFGRGAEERGGVRISLGEEGTVKITASGIDMGQGIRAAFRQLTKEILSVPPDIIDVRLGDTDFMPPGTGALGQRQTVITGNALIRAALLFKEKVMAAASKMLQTDDLELEEGNIIKRSSATNLANLADLYEWMQRATGQIIESSYDYVCPQTHALEDFSAFYPRRYVGYSYVAQAAVVAVDNASGHVEVIKLIGVHDTGKTLKPLIAKGQIEGSMIMGLGYALREKFDVKGGVSQAKNFFDCGLPRASDVPEMEVLWVEEPMGDGPFGAKGMSEVANVPTAPAITNAIYDAVGVRITRLPSALKPDNAGKQDGKVGV